MLFQGLVFTISYLIYAVYNLLQDSFNINLYDMVVKIFFLIVFLGLGVIVNLVITAAYFNIQSYFDPLIPIPMGSPVARYYTRTVHLIIQNSVLLYILKWIYPAYIITGFSSQMIQNQMNTFSPFINIGILLCIITNWIKALNRLIIKVCQKHQS